MKGLLVPAWTLGYEKGGFRCKDCFLKVEMSSPLPPYEFPKGASFDNRIRCPVCSSSEKEPTKKATEEELEEKKAEIRERLK